MIGEVSVVMTGLRSPAPLWEVNTMDKRGAAPPAGTASCCAASDVLNFSSPAETPAALPPTLKLSMPNWTPPYTPRVCGRTPFSASRIFPPSTWTWESKRSFQSCGTSMQHASDSAAARWNHDSSRLTPDSSKYFASTVDRATSRSWWMALLLSAIRSKLCVNSLAYLTNGWSGLVSGASSMPSAPMICSRASTPILMWGTKTLSSDIDTSACLTTNHSRADQSLSWHPPSEKRSKQLFMPITGCSYSPMDSSFKK
mmetsp:Transcript_69949/g.197365  ORF Transcript_69949/g.197365 Transcript_69949/m.197365 type:complete len:256 (-) Transcript_69949:78-845(-)